MIDLDAIKARLASATPGPWQDTGWNSIRARTGNWICQFYDKTEEDFSNDRANLCFIAHTPEDIAALLAEVEHLQEKLAIARTALSEPESEVYDNG